MRKQKKKDTEKRKGRTPTHPFEETKVAGTCARFNKWKQDEDPQQHDSKRVKFGNEHNE